MKASKKWFFYSSFLAIFLFLIIYIYISNIDISYNKDYLIIITFILIGVKSIKEILIDRYSYSINKIFWYFIFVFLFVAPLYQYLTSYIPGEYYIDKSLYLEANLIIILWIFTYSLSKKIAFKENQPSDNKFFKSLKFKNYYLKYLLIINLIIFIIMSIFIGIPNFFITQNNKLGNSISFINDILNNGMRVVPVFSIIYTYYHCKYNNKKSICLIIFLIITIILNFPTSTTRYWIGVVYLGLLIIVFNKFIKNRFFDILVIIGLFIVFPFLQIFKWYTLSDILSGNIKITNFLTIFNNMDFDAYYLFQRSLAYVHINQYTFGKQLTSSIFFFIPRAIWNNKPYPTGQFLGISQNSSFTNLSCPLIGEMFIDFGILGVVLSAIILSRVISKLDYFYFNKEILNGTRLIEYVYPFLLGFVFFMMRGSLQPVVVFMFTFYLPLILIIKKIFKYKEN